MTSREKIFHTESKAKAADLEHRAIINRVLKQSDEAFRKGTEQFADLENAKRQAARIKSEALAHLDQYLLAFEARFTRAGGKVIWAENAQQALDAIGAICAQKRASLAVKSKSMVTEEIHLNPFLAARGIEVIETDLGEYIQQLADEPPYHIVAPSLHKTRAEVAHLFHEKMGVPPGLSPEELTLAAREKLRLKFREAEIGITGANFILADIGGIAITENEGNARLTTSFPKTHIVLTGIEKVLPSVNDLGLFWPLLATHGSGQKVTVYNSIFTGPRKKGEVDGPEEMYVILLDNGRTTILADPVARESLQCIRCGACLNVCPVYKSIGGHTYRSTYSGPIGSVITPYLRGISENKHLSYASSLCGACTDVCPVKISLHQLLLHNRHRAVRDHHTSSLEKTAWKGWKVLMNNRRLLDAVGGRVKNVIMETLFSGGWGPRRKLPIFSGKSFSKQWKEKKS
ncbi:LutB/LldF family L-lactate oxidation iron-sulfur protein [Larkinella harenae]